MSDEVYISSGLLLTISWQMPYLDKGCNPNFNNGLRAELNCGPISPRRLFESDLNNGPSPGHFNIVLDEAYICSGLVLIVSWQVLSLAKDRRPDFNYELGADSNSGHYSSQTSRTVAPGVFLSQSLIMVPPQAIPILNCKHELALKLF